MAAFNKQDAFGIAGAIDDQCADTENRPFGILAANTAALP
jgi:hypothetical protein